MNLIIDANNLAYRARHAYHLSYRGHDTSVTYGTMRMLLALLKKLKPSSCIFCWDGGTPNFRKRLVPSYKEHRKAKEEDPTWPAFLAQLQELQSILYSGVGILQVRRVGIEADDLMAHAARMLPGKSIIVTTDNDLLQCVNENTSVYSPIKDTMFTVDNFEELIGYPVHQFLRAKVLQGDSSDGIKGVRGVGPKTALKLLAGHEDKVPKSTQLRLQEFLDSGRYEASHAVIDLTDDMAGARYVLRNAMWCPYSKKAVVDWCLKWGFTSLLVDVGSLGVIFGGLKKPEFTKELVAPRIWDYKRFPLLDKDA